MSATNRRATATPPEPDLTQEAMIERAIAMRPELISDQAETEQRTFYSPEMHQRFLDAGFYHLYVPRRYGGYEFDVPTYMRVVLADVEQEPLELAVAEIRGGGAEAVGVHADVSRAEDVQALADATIASFGAVHVVCDNAGVESGGGEGHIVNTASLAAFATGLPTFAWMRSDDAPPERQPGRAGTEPAGEGAISTAGGR